MRGQNSEIGSKDIGQYANQKIAQRLTTLMNVNSTIFKIQMPYKRIERENKCTDLVLSKR